MRGNRKLWGPTFLVGALVAALAAPAAAGNHQIEPTKPTPWQQTTPTDDFEVADGLWFVEFGAAPSVRGGPSAAQANERAAFRREARAEGLDVREERDFRTLWNGVTVRADAAEIGSISQLRSVTNVYPVAVVERPEPQDISPDLGTALGMTGADAAQSELGLSGEGLAVAIIDTGIDYNHPDLGGDGDDANRITADPNTREMDHPRITHGWDYVGTEFNPADPDAPTTPAPNPDPRDTQGHGTHVAGIVGADAADEDGVTGVAPGVTFGAYKVFGPGSTTADVIVEALEDAYADGMDIVNMSLGAALAWGQDYPTSRASNELANAGVVVVNSAGNSGGLGAWTLSAPANAHDIISVASADNTHVNARGFIVEGLEEAVPYMELTGAELPPTEGESEPLWAAPVVPVLNAAGEQIDQGRFGCAAGDFADLPDGNVALVERGHCTFATKYVNAAEAGASGVVIYNNVSGLFSGTVGDAGIDGVWGAGITDADGDTLVGMIKEGEVRLTFTDERVTAVNPTGGLASSFTSYGQDIELEFGPSVMAPGGLIVSTYPLARGGYASLSGTSMAAPHVAGAAALMLEQDPSLDPFDVRDRMQNTAEPAAWSLNPGLPFKDHTFRQGAGLIQVDRAITAQQFALPAQLSLGDTETTTTTITVANRGAEDVTYTVGHELGIEIAGSTFTPGFLLWGADIDAAETLTVAAGSSADLEVTITGPHAAGAANHQYGGYLVLTPDTDDATTLRVPYAGFAGDYVGEMALFGFWTNSTTFREVEPVLARFDGDGAAVVAEPGHVFRPRAGDAPMVAPFFGHSPQQLELWVIDRRGQRYLVHEQAYVPRSAEPIVRQLYAWDGTLPAGRSDNRRAAPSGEYTLELRVLRATGDADNADHWDTWTSPTFRVNPGR